MDDIYSSKILALAANMPRSGRLASFHGAAEKTAKLCGSVIGVEVLLDEDDRVADFAQDVRACALGQASAAVLGANVIGADLTDILFARNALRAMLKEGGPVPVGRFAELAVLSPVKDYPARHASTLLAFEAAVEAVTVALSRPGGRTSPAVAG